MDKIGDERSIMIDIIMRKEGSHGFLFNRIPLSLRYPSFTSSVDISTINIDASHDHLPGNIGDRGVMIIIPVGYRHRLLGIVEHDGILCGHSKQNPIGKIEQRSEM
jgi:hypothetical protein